MAQPKKLAQPTSFGAPRKPLSRKFYQVASRFLGKANRVLHVISVSLCVSALGLLVYLGLWAHLEDVFVSDGSRFSCQAPEISQKGQ